MTVLLQLILTDLHVLAECNWCTWEYCPKVTTVGTKTIEGNIPQCSPCVQLAFVIVHGRRERLFVSFNFVFSSI